MRLLAFKPTVDERLRHSNGRPSGFDYLRLGLALGVFAMHILPTTYGDETLAPFYNVLRPVSAILLPMFFALSGFLVAGSLERCKTLVSFAGLRIIRIVPALAVEVFVSGVILGAIFTTWPLHRYFFSRWFVNYAWNIVGVVQFSLPGVFDTNPHPGTVNQQIWTVPWELDCYLLLGLLAICGVVRKPVMFIASIALFCVAALVYDLLHPPILWVNSHGIILVESFIVGVAFYRFRTVIRLSPGLFVASLAATLALLFVPPGGTFPYGDYFVALPATYVTVYLGVLNPPRNKLAFSGDYSYGIYLYGFPIQQAVAAVAPGSITASLLVALPLTLALATGSWWFVEKQALRFRHWLPRLEDHLLDSGERLVGARMVKPLVLNA